ncbi:MAG: 50S ribosomal protein L18 [Patescibacteria group bacterium]
MDTKTKRKNRIRRHKRVRAVVKGTKDRPRLSVFRSANHIYAQLIDDVKSITLLSSSDLEEALDKNKSKVAFKVGEILAVKALKKGINNVVFDRGGYKYHGRVKALAEGARQGGLKF